MHGNRSAHHPAAKSLSHGLVTEAHAKGGNHGGDISDKRQADACLVRGAGSRGEHNGLRIHPDHLIHRDHVIAMDYDICTEST